VSMKNYNIKSFWLFHIIDKFINNHFILIMKGWLERRTIHYYWGKKELSNDSCTKQSGNNNLYPSHPFIRLLISHTRRPNPFWIHNEDSDITKSLCHH